MTAAEVLTSAKLAMAITSTAYDAELGDLIAAATEDLESNGINAGDLITAGNPLVLQAIKTYCRANFQSPADYDRLLASYNAQKGHMRQSTGYTTWPTDEEDEEETDEESTETETDPVTTEGGAEDGEG